eukprot:CAMPEP_0196656694 /NCGR_PEP_ID=MMETSP1086-20130531/19388_1 /TAXON_ID=77921 /ORGANISM="Cyanoptyche  gloeocystis , Strain SAG4.97" /LENGTH=133 /DNA_ID=CAMNT_0041989543 /DNA_START=221 /DNA_END=622 /DNA_ORIENTATION=-
MKLDVDDRRKFAFAETKAPAKNLEVSKVDTSTSSASSKSGELSEAEEIALTVEQEAENLPGWVKSMGNRAAYILGGGAFGISVFLAGLAAYLDRKDAVQKRARVQAKSISKDVSNNRDSSSNSESTADAASAS